jgi:hypothetical protein
MNDPPDQDAALGRRDLEVAVTTIVGDHQRRRPRPVVPDGVPVVVPRTGRRVRSRRLAHHGRGRDREDRRQRLADPAQRCVRRLAVRHGMAERDATDGKHRNGGDARDDGVVARRRLAVMAPAMPAL